MDHLPNVRHFTLTSILSGTLTEHSIWGIADGSRNIDVNAEIIAYAVLDILAKPVFGFWLLFTHDNFASTASIDGFWAHGLGKEGTLRVGDDDEGA